MEVLFIRTASKDLNKGCKGICYEIRHVPRHTTNVLNKGTKRNNCHYLLSVGRLVANV